MVTIYKTFYQGPWSYGSWIYNYLCNLWLSPLMLLVRLPLRARSTTLCDKVCQQLSADRCFSPGHPVSSTNKTDCHNITEILLKVVLNTIKPTNQPKLFPPPYTAAQQLIYKILTYYSRPSDIRLPLLQWKSGIFKGIASLEG